MSINFDQNNTQESYNVIILALTEARETIPRLSIFQSDDNFKFKKK